MVTEQEQRAIRMWTRGDYRIVGDWFTAASQDCLDGVVLKGKQLLDVACGTGAVAIEAAKRGATVTGVDLTPAMLEEAKCRANDAGVAVDFQQGSFMDLSGYKDADVVTSAFGVMFAMDPSAVLRELFRVCRPGGLISLTAWAPDGAFGRPSPAVIEAIPQLGGGPNITRWATQDGLSAILAETALDPAQHSLAKVEKRTIKLPFVSADECITLMIEHSGPWSMLFEYLQEQGKASQARQLLLDHLKQFSVPVAGGIHLHVTYTIAHFQRN